jgi:hypothetical protein
MIPASCLRFQELEGADVCFGDVSDPSALAATAFSEPVDVVVSCLASRTGGKVRSSLEPGQHQAMHMRMLAEDELAVTQSL